MEQVKTKKLETIQSENEGYIRSCLAKMSNAISTNCRLIAYGSIAALWVASYEAGENMLIERDACIRLILLFSVYAIVDILQYCAMTVGYYMLFFVNKSKIRSKYVYRTIDKLEILGWSIFTSKTLIMFGTILYFLTTFIKNILT